MTKQERVRELVVLAKDLGYVMTHELSTITFKSALVEVNVFIPLGKIEIDINKTTDKQINLLPIVDLANKALDIFGKRVFIVSKQVMDRKDNFISFDSWRYSTYDKAVKAFHIIEQELVEQGFDLDDDTSDSTLDDVLADNFFNTATSDKFTVLLFLDKVFKYGKIKEQRYCNVG